MKCSYCPANRNDSYEYPEYYCALGVNEDDTIEFKDGEYGCRRRSYDKINADLKIQDEIEGEAFAEMAKGMVEFWESEKESD